MAAKEKIAWVKAEATPSLIPIAHCPLFFYYHTCRNLATHDSRTIATQTVEGGYTMMEDQKRGYFFI